MGSDSGLATAIAACGLCAILAIALLWLMPIHQDVPRNALASSSVTPATSAPSVSTVGAGGAEDHN